MNSKQKGNRGERELANLLKTYGYPTRRGVQYNGRQGDADVIGINGIHIECKRCQKVTDEAFMKQAERDARKGDIPVVMYRRNNEQWKVTLRLNMFMTIWGMLTDEQKRKIRDKIKYSL